MARRNVQKTSPKMRTMRTTVTRKAIAKIVPKNPPPSGSRVTPGILGRRSPGS